MPPRDASNVKTATHVNSMNYSITLRHDVPNYSWFWLAAFLLLIPPVFLTHPVAQL